MQELVFATNNEHKLQEMRQILGDKFTILSLSDIGCHDEIPETAPTLEGNAEIKARWIWDRYHRDCFADDTGLMVDALNGEPGVYSARYAGDHCSPTDNVKLLLKNMASVPEDKRTARFSTVIALIRGGNVQYVTGTVEGKIMTAPDGKGGFGYDPVFQPEGYEMSFASMAAAEKNAISHRGRAARNLYKLITG